MKGPKTKSHMRQVHIVMPKPTATPDQLRQLAAAKEIVEQFLRDLDDEDEADLSMAAHFAHEFLWTHAGGAEAKWKDFPIDHYFLDLVPVAAPMPPELCGKLMDDTCKLFRWLGKRGLITAADAIDLCARAESVRGEMLEIAEQTFGAWNEEISTSMNRFERRAAAAMGRKQKTMLN